MENKKITAIIAVASLLSFLPSISLAAEDIPMLNSIINVAFLITGACIAVGAVIVGGMFLTAGGSDEKLSKAKKSLVWLVIGITIYLGIHTIKNVITGIVVPKEAPGVTPIAPPEE